MSDGSCPENDGLANGYFNTFFFYDNGEGSATNCYSGSYYYGCQGLWSPYNNPIPLSTANANYVYAEGVLSAAYHGQYPGYGPYSSLPAAITMQYYIRGWVAVGDGTFVVWDRAQAKKTMNDGSNYIGNIRWHLPTTTPTVAGNTVSSVTGSSKLYISSFLPSGSEPTITGPCEIDAGAAMSPYGGGGPWPCT